MGPLSLGEVGRHIEAGRVDRDSLVWKVGMDDWLPAGEVPAVRALFDKVPMPRIARLEEEPRRSSGFDMGGDDLLAAAPPSPFDDPEDASSWRPHGLTAVYQAANLAETAGMGALGVAVGPGKPPSIPPLASGNDEWRPGAASALASLVHDEIKRLDNGPPPAIDDDLSPADDASINAPLFGGLGNDAHGLESGPEINDPLPRAQRSVGLERGHTSQPFAAQQSGFQPAPAPPAQKLSPVVMLGALGGAMLLLVVVALVFVVVSNADKEPKIVVVDGKPYLQQPDGSLLDMGRSSDKPKEEAKIAAAAEPAAPVPPAVVPPPLPTTPDVAAAAAVTGAAVKLDQVAVATPPPPVVEDKVVKARSSNRPKEKEREKEKPVEKVEPAKTAKAGDCDPVLDFDCKAGVKSASSSASKEPVKDTLSKTDVLLIVKNNMSKVEDCGRKNKVGGIIKMSWKIQPSGKVSDVQVADSKFAGTPVGGCVANTIKGWKFPASKVSTPVNFPMKLGS